MKCGRSKRLNLQILTKEYLKAFGKEGIIQRKVHGKEKAMWVDIKGTGSFRKQQGWQRSQRDHIIGKA